MGRRPRAHALLEVRRQLRLLDRGVYGPLGKQTRVTSASRFGYSRSLCHSGGISFADMLLCDCISVSNSPPCRWWVASSRWGTKEHQAMASAESREAAVASSTPASVINDRPALKMSAGGSFAETVVGVATVVLAILGLSGIYPGYLAAIAGIVVGAGLMMHGAACACRSADSGTA